MKFIHVIGARPQFVKYAPVAIALGRFTRKKKADLKNLVIHTGQHYDRNMSEVFFQGLGIPPPDYFLNVRSGSHGEQTARILTRTEKVFYREKPDLVVVYGDTNTTLGAALAAAKMHIPVAHVESGLRSYNKQMPEEINRILTDQVSSLFFCTSKNAVEVLRREGRVRRLNNGNLIPWAGPDQKVPHWDMDHPLAINVGDVMRDVFESTRAKALTSSKVLKQFSLKPRRYVVVTVHRAENTSDTNSFEKIIRFINSSAKGKMVIFPMHPRTRGVYAKSNVRFSSLVQVIDPLSYLDVVALVSQAEMVMTDSGGLQKEAFWSKVPCVTLRNETEWIETVKAGWNILYKNYKGIWPFFKKGTECYGDGRAAMRIARVLLSFKDKGGIRG
ncbi:MAG: UDP-N-acetyl glucosamine 2-epimerase [Elusimicrobia bacterium]|nr:UDP-N-acetyl glucosamine 2-epimerase [Elusimicrobiota bacterium]